MVKYIFFDLDGTLIDPELGIINAVMYALDKYSISVDKRESLYEFIGPPLVDSFMKYYGFDEEKADEAVRYYREYYGVKGVYENVLYKGIDSLLEKLYNDGHTIILATSKPHKFAVQILEYLKIDKYFHVITGSGLDGSLNTKTKVLEYAIEKAMVRDKSKAVMIGDRRYDIEGANNVGLRSIGVLYGYGSEAELNKAGADYIASTIEDVENIIYSM